MGLFLAKLCFLDDIPITTPSHTLSNKFELAITTTPPIEIIGGDHNVTVWGWIVTQ